MALTILSKESAIRKPAYKYMLSLQQYCIHDVGTL